MKSSIFNLQFSILVFLFLASACTSEEPDSIAGNTQKPAWAVPENYDMTASMTAIVKVDLALSYPEQVVNLPDSLRRVNTNDLLAAFDGNNCVGVAELVDNLFFLYITAPASEDESSLTLKYYSANLKNIFLAKDPITFRNDTQLGSVAEPYTPTFIKQN